MEKVNYFKVSELGDIANKWYKNNPHNNGYAIRWIVTRPEESAYPEMESYFIEKGIEINQYVILHSTW